MLVQTKRQRNVDLTATIYFHCRETLIDVCVTWQNVKGLKQPSNFDISPSNIAAIHLKYNRAVIPDQEIYCWPRFIPSYKTGADTLVKY